MKPERRYILYCIFQSPENQKPPRELKINDRLVRIISGSGLKAVISGILPGETKPDVSHILAYKKMVEQLHSHPAVSGIIPMRYGAFFERKHQITRMLESNREHYISLLRKLDGCVEMGVRVLLEVSGTREEKTVSGLENGRIKNRSAPAENARAQGRQSTSGKDYLAARKACYQQEKQYAEQMDEAAKNCRKVFSGLFTESKTEYVAPGFLNNNAARTVVSLYFLVPRKFMEQFKFRFQELSRLKHAKFLLSGSWPPYNFVTGGDLNGKDNDKNAEPKNLGALQEAL